MTMVDASSDAGNLEFRRFEPALVLGPIHLEARVGHVTNNGSYCEPCLAFAANDSTLPPNSPDVISYPLSFYSDHIDLRLHYPPWEDYVLLSIPVPDLATAFHVVSLDTDLFDIGLYFRVCLDGQEVGQTAGPWYPPINSVVFGHRLSVGTGTSQWDYLRYWFDSSTPSTQPSWGQVKAKYATPAPGKVTR